MSSLKAFVKTVRQEFPDDRLTRQNQVPTFHPECAEEAARLVKLALKSGQRLFIAGFGNNIQPVGEPFVNMMVLKTDRLNRLHEINAKDLFVTAGAGYPIREINRQLHEANLFMPHSLLPYVGSVGGALAVGLSADFDGHDLPLKRYFLRAEIVTPEGEIITPGSICFKSVSGYDVVKLFAGSWGLLGLIVSASLRVMPSSVIDDYQRMRMKAADRDNFLAGLADDNDSPDAVYSRKIKQKFDPGNVLPIV
ncbi:MAG: FAD-binding oxidoreductase [candidate division Zixibacteria bacterium]|nr:FAD-binding oxidoreductase [candidate division Zixibacteria bacterium]